MFKVRKVNKNNVVSITASGTLTKEDYSQLLPEIELMLQQHKVFHFYITLENFTGFEANALWENIKFDYKYKDQYGKIAIVGEKKWEEWGAKFSKLFFDAEIKYFYEEDAIIAWEWINTINS